MRIGSGCWRLAVRLLFSLLLLGVAHARADADTFIVNTVTDTVDGPGCDLTHCSLREAITAANANAGADRIEFAIIDGGAGATKTIQILGAVLPAITGDLVIDGYTQAGASANTRATGSLDAAIRVQLQGDPLVGSGIETGFLISGPRVTIRGLSVTDFRYGFALTDVSIRDVAIAGNFIGLGPDGAAPGNGSHGVLVSYGSNIVIGGALPADRNLISGHTMNAVRLERASGDPIGLAVQGNLIGTRADGITAAPNHDAITLDHGIWFPTADDRILIGGEQEAEGNVIGGDSTGLNVLGSFTSAAGYSLRVVNNRFGTDWSETATLSFAFHAISFSGYTPAHISRNVVTNALSTSIVITGARSMDGRGIEIVDNRIHGSSALGIDLGNDDRTPNDPDDADDGPNARLNYPVLTAQVDGSSGVTRLGATIQAEPNTRYRLQVFDLGAAARPDGWDATRKVYETLVQTDNNGQAAFVRYPLLAGVTTGHHLSATLTHETLGYTSEISDTVATTTAGPTIDGLVTLTNGTTPVPFASVVLSGPENRTTLTDEDGRYVFFDLPTGGPYTVTVSAQGYTFPAPQVAVPHLTARRELDFVATADTLPAFVVNVTHDLGTGACTVAECTLRAAIDAANGHPGPDTIAFAIPGAGPHTIALNGPLPDLRSDLLLDGYTQPGAQPNTRATGGLDTVLRIALEPTGATGAMARGLRIAGDRVTVRGLDLDGFERSIIIATDAGGQQVALEGNFLGSTIDGRHAGQPSPDGRGITLTGDGTASVTIGGLTPAARNLIADHGGAGIEWTTHTASHPLTLVVQGNLIGTSITGRTALPNMQGLMVASGPGATADIVRIGGDEAGAANVMASNSVGLWVGRALAADAPGAQFTIAGNFIGVSADGRLLGSMNAGIGFCGEMQATVRRNTLADMGTGIALCAGLAGRVTITENVMYGIYGIAIDLGQDGPTSNDAGDQDSGPNDLQNSPTVTSVVEFVAGADVTGTLDSLPLRTYRIELFRTGPGWMAAHDARELMATFTVETDAAGAASFSQRIGILQPEDTIVATATDVQTGATSELSAPTMVMSLNRYQISGRLTYGTQPLAQVEVRLTGDRTQTVQSDSGGYFDFSGLPATGTYHVTPSDAAWRFTPASATLPNLQDDELLEFAAVPSTYTRYLAEGATGDFWETTIALLNPSRTAITADVTFMLPDGRTEQLAVPLTGPGHGVIDPAAIPALKGTTFSTKVFATEAVVANRTMRWGLRRELGAHAEQAVSQARTAWSFAEGATGCFDLFYQLANPNATAAEVEVTFVRRAPEAPVVRTYTIAPYSRHTIHANAEEGLAFAEVSAQMRVTNNQPIVAERAMYANCFGASWRGGHDAAGSPAPATVWRLAEGATGSFFDLYYLIANFETKDAEVDVQYMLPDGMLITKTYSVPARSRITIDVAGEAPQLASTAVSAYITAGNDVPFVAERAQWWPHGNWYEGHVSAGAATFGYEWHVAGAQVGTQAGAQGGGQDGGSHALSGYLLIANTGSRAGSAQVTAVFNDGSTATLAEPVALKKLSRTTVDLAAAFPQAAGQSFGLIVTSLGSSPAPIVVELSTYGDTSDDAGTRFWGAGTSVLGTRAR